MTADKYLCVGPPRINNWWEVCMGCRWNAIQLPPFLSHNHQGSFGVATDRANTTYYMVEWVRPFNIKTPCEPVLLLKLDLCSRFTFRSHTGPAVAVKVECCHAYGGLPAWYPNWSIPDPTPQLRSCNNSREVASELGEVIFHFPAFSSCCITRYCLLYNMLLSPVLYYCWWMLLSLPVCMAARACSQLSQFSGGLRCLVAPSKYHRNSLKLHCKVIMMVLYASRVP